MQRCQESLENTQQTAAISTYKKTLLKPRLSGDQCRCYGEKRHKSKADCPAKDYECSCGKKGHFKRFCFSGGKKKIKQEKQENEENNGKDNVLDPGFKWFARLMIDEVE